MFNSDRPYANRYALRAPDGSPLEIPIVCEQNDPYLALAPSERRAHLLEHGYVVVRNLVPPELCRSLGEAFEREVKPSRDFFLRHESGRPERHVFTSHGHMKYPLMNVQDLPQGRFPGFRQGGLELATHPSVQATVEGLLASPGRLLHTMFFDGNQVTWAHHDSYYIDSAEIGAMIGMWIALEDIRPGAGRFYVYPGSHRLPMPQLGTDFDLDPNTPAYRAYVLDLIRHHGLACHAPALRRGDAIFWSSRTIHGSLETTQPEFSRRCLTGHWIPRDHDYVWFHSNRPRSRSTTINGVPVHFHRDQNRWGSRLDFLLEAYLPGPYHRLQRLRF